MRARRAGFRGFFPLVEIPAIPTIPDRRLVLAEDRSCFEIFQELAIARFVILLGDRDQIKDSRYGFKAFLAGDGGELRVELGPFLVLPASGGAKAGMNGS